MTYSVQTKCIVGSWLADMKAPWQTIASGKTKQEAGELRAKILLARVPCRIEKDKPAITKKKP